MLTPSQQYVLIKCFCFEKAEFVYIMSENVNNLCSLINAPLLLYTKVMVASVSAGCSDLMSKTDGY